MTTRSTLPQLTAQVRAVLATIAYTDQFAYPLTLGELRERVLSVPQYFPKDQPRFMKHPVQSLADAVRLLQQHKLIESVRTPTQRGHAEYFCLAGRSTTLQSRLQKERYAAKKAVELKMVLHFIKKVPWIQEVYLTGSQAMSTADPDSDVDFMVITAPKRLWLTRIIVSFFAQVQGKRRSWNREEPGSWCFNLWLDSNHLTVDPERQDVYRAYEVFQAKLLWARNGREYLFKRQNPWMQQFLPNASINKMGSIFSEKKKPSNQKQRPVLAFLFDLIDWLAWQFQSWYMSKHRTTEKVGRGFAFFHPRDTGKVITEGWLKSLQQSLPKSVALEILQPYVGRIARSSNPHARSSSKD